MIYHVTIGGQHIEAHLHPEVISLCVGLVIAYYALVRRYGRVMVPHGRPVSVRHQACFLSGILVFWVASGSPLHDLGERYLYSAHMLQHLLQAFVAPPLVLLGIPTWMGEVLLKPDWWRATVRFIAKPLLAAVVFNVALVVTHWPAMVDLMVVSETWHFFMHFMLVVAAFAMWLPILSPAPHLVPVISPLLRMLYLFAQTIVPTIPSSFLTFGDQPLYRVYETFPRLWSLSALNDMQLAGLIMKVGGGFLLWGIITVMFFRWAAAQEREEAARGRLPAHPEFPTPRA